MRRRCGAAPECRDRRQPPGAVPETTNTSPYRGASAARELGLEVETTTGRVRRVPGDQVGGAHPLHAAPANERVLLVVPGDLRGPHRLRRARRLDGLGALPRFLGQQACRIGPGGVLPDPADQKLESVRVVARSAEPS